MIHNHKTKISTITTNKILLNLSVTAIKGARKLIHTVLRN